MEAFKWKLLASGTHVGNVDDDEAARKVYGCPLLVTVSHWGIKPFSPC